MTTITPTAPIDRGRLDALLGRFVEDLGAAASPSASSSIGPRMRTCSTSKHHAARVPGPVRLATFFTPGGSEPLAGEVRGEDVVAFSSGTVRDRLAARDLSPAAGDTFALAEVTLLAPVPRPRAIFGIGLNYAAHAAAQGKGLPRFPIVFMKLPASSVPPAGPVRRPAVVEQLVVGAGGAIAGWAVADDVTARDLQGREAQWTRAKGFDTSCPWGPWITTVDELPDPRGLRIGSWVNGEQRQDSTTDDLVFGPQEIVDFISQTCTLEPGDLILTGTPEGVGMALDPPRYLEPGDVVRVEIERLGSIEHRISVCESPDR
jgi:2-keto-4-pentenoate hydratase/2-oxohepta-3-ene-1,7-dioic acid hydratase in catechol pathway